jgi:hypothetical protein
MLFEPAAERAATAAALPDPVLVMPAASDGVGAVVVLAGQENGTFGFTPPLAESEVFAVLVTAPDELESLVGLAAVLSLFGASGQDGTGAGFSVSDAGVVGVFASADAVSDGPAGSCGEAGDLVSPRPAFSRGDADSPPKPGPAPLSGVELDVVVAADG